MDSAANGPGDPPAAAPPPPPQGQTRIPPPPTDGMRLHVGGTVRAPGWHVLNIAPGPAVDIVADCKDLGMLPDGGCAVVYASHVLEHLGYNGDIQQALAGFHRVLKPGGHLMISVPDLDTLCRLFLDPTLAIEERYYVMRMIFGGRTDRYDVHLVGLNADILGAFLVRAGFGGVYRVAPFTLFKDASAIRYKNVAISLNMLAVKTAG